jgi:Fic family protein
VQEILNKGWSAGAIRTTLGGYKAFHPNPLPTSLDYPENTVTKLAEATAAVHRLGGISRLLARPELLIGSYVRLEAVLTSRIEGTRTTIGDLLEYEAVDGGEPTGDLREVTNYLRALDHAVRRLGELPLSNRLLREAHALLMEGVRGEHADPGEFRATQNWIGAPGSTLTNARFVPPPPVEAKDAMGELERFLHDRSLPDLIAIGLAHYQFETIHPFVDGNGRIGRLLIILMLIEREILAAPVIYLSAYFEENRQTYYDLLDHTRSTSDLFPWLDFFLTGVTVMATEGEQRAVRLTGLQHSVRTRLLDRGASPTALRLCELIFDTPYVTAAGVAKRLDVTFPTAQKAIDDLIRADILEEITGQQRNRVYMARSVSDAVYQTP